MDECPTCGDSFKSIGNHWQFNLSHRPSFTDEQLEIMTGLLMGDASILYKDRKTPILQAQMENLEYLQYLDRKLGIMSVEPKEVSTKEGIYFWSTRASDDFNDLKAWYDSGEKVFPKSLQLSPTILKHWYVCDGSLRRGNTVKICCHNEVDNKKKIESYFAEADLPKPSYWTERGSIEWSVENSSEILEYMGEPIDGFKYKWP